MIVSILIGYYSFYDYDFNIPFQYNHTLMLQDLNSTLPIILIMFLGFFLGSKLQRSRNRTYDAAVIKSKLGVKIRFTNIILIRSDFMYIVLSISILLYFFYFPMVSSHVGSFRDLDDARIIGGKENLPLLFMILIFSLLSRYRFISLIICISACVCIGWFNGSRSALIPLLYPLILTLVSNKKYLLLPSLLIVIYFYVFIFLARSEMDKFNLLAFIDVIQSVPQEIYYIIIQTVGYLTAFSILHFVYCVKLMPGEFYVKDLIYSITPIPSSLIPIEVDTSLWRVDTFRPLGGVYEIYSVSPFAMFIFFVLLGFIFKGADEIKSRITSLFFLPLSFFILVFSFQYSLRGVQWFIYLYCFVLVLIYRKEKNVTLSNKF